MQNKNWDKIAELRFEQISSKKDITFLKIFKPFYIDLAKKSKPNKVLEIGSGTGHMSLYLSDYVNYIYALEPSFNMFNLSKTRLLQKKTNIQIFNTSIEMFSEKVKFDLIFSQMCLQTIKKPTIFLKEASKYLSGRDSKLVISIPHPCFWNKYKKWFSDNRYLEEFYIEAPLSISLCQSATMVSASSTTYFPGLS